ncbi:MAG: hypothetical protein R3B09_04380 [Nannocystaceae bacterium]
MDSSDIWVSEGQSGQGCIDVQAAPKIQRVHHLINMVAQRSSALLGAPEGVGEYESWVRSLEATYGVSIAVQTTMGPDNRPSAIDGVISSHAAPTGYEWAFRIDRHETRCCLRMAPLADA